MRHFTLKTFVFRAERGDLVGNDACRASGKVVESLSTVASAECEAMPAADSADSLVGTAGDAARASGSTWDECDDMMMI